MAFVPITKELFANKRFKRNLTYHSAGRDAIAPLTLHELPKAMLHVPIAFARIEDSLMPVAMQGLGQSKNLFVAPDGRWIGRYLPFCYRFAPFVLASVEPTKQVLCCDDSSDLISDTEGEPFFDPQGEPSKEVTAIMQLLGQHAKNRQATLRLSALLEEHKLIAPWPIKLKVQESENEATLSGLFRIDEEMLNGLGADALAALNQAGAFPMIYCQLLSMQHLPMLGELSKAHHVVQQRASSPVDEDPETDLTFTADDSRITFEDL